VSSIIIRFHILLLEFQLKACVIAITSLIPETDLRADVKDVNNACVDNKASYFVLKSLFPLTKFYQIKI
jgi:hypothetical protein